MDPNYQVDETFAKTVTGIEELRAKYRGNDGMDWKEWRRTLVSAAQAGAQLERRVNGLAMEFAKAARAAVVADIDIRVKQLEWEQKQRWGFKGWMYGIASGVIVGLIIVFVDHRLK